MRRKGKVFVQVVLLMIHAIDDSVRDGFVTAALIASLF